MQAEEGKCGTKVSVVMPFFHKWDQLKFSLKYNMVYFKEHNVELVLVVDHPCSDDQLDGIVQSLSGINYKILVNPQDHKWRNPGITINAGIKSASGEFIIVMSPESIFKNDGISILVENCTERSFSIGIIDFMHYDEFIKGEIDKGSQPNIIGVPFGSICFRKSDILKVGGYTESYKQWGGDDCNVRLKLTKSGIKKKETNAYLVHLETKAELNNRYEKHLQVLNNKNWQKIESHVKSLNEMGLGFVLRVENCSIIKN
jgi:hypothetical protein